MFSFAGRGPKWKAPSQVGPESPPKQALATAEGLGRRGRRPTNNLTWYRCDEVLLWDSCGLRARSVNVNGWSTREGGLRLVGWWKCSVSSATCFAVCSPGCRKGRTAAAARARLTVQLSLACGSNSLSARGMSCSTNKRSARVRATHT